jgi:hypothetical protein
LLNESTGGSNASIREAIIYNQIELHGCSLNFRGLALKRTDYVHPLYTTSGPLFSLAAFATHDFQLLSILSFA